VRVEPRELLRQVHAVGAAVARSAIEHRMRAAVEDVVASVVRTPVRLPWRPPAPAMERLATAGRRQGAGAWSALERLWFFFWVHGLVADRLRSRAIGRARLVQFRAADWVAAMEADARTPALLTASRRRPGSPEPRYVAEALEALSCSLSPPRLLRSLPRLGWRHINWERGEILLEHPSAPRRCMTGGCSPYRLGLLARLALGRLALFYDHHPEHVGEETPEFLPPRWRRPGALARVVRRWGQGHAPGRTVPELLRALRLVPLLHGPALFAHLQAGALSAGWRAREEGPSRARAPSRAVPAPHDAGSSDEDPEAMAEVRFLLRRVSARMGMPERRQIAADLKRLLPALGARETPPWNQALITAWAIHLLGTPRVRGNTIRTWLSGLYRDLRDHLTVSVLGLDQDELAEVVLELVFSQRHAESQRAMKGRLRQFLFFLRARHGGPALNWRDPHLAVAPASTALSLVTPDEAEEALRRLQTDWPTEAAALTLAMILAFWCGLRRHEVCALAVESILPGPWGSIRIERSKTRAGRRTVPGALLTPAPLWAQVDDYRRGRLADTGPGRAPLLVTPRGQAWTPDDLGRRVATLLRAVTGRAVSMHSLRHGFASVTLLRWGVAQGRASWPDAWGHAAVAPPSLAGVRLALGEDDTLVLHRLSRICGHAAPGVTVAHYLVMDVVREAWRADSAPVRLRSAVAADLLQCSAPAMYQHLRPVAHGWVDAEDVLRAQLARRRRRHGGPHGEGDS
jgi:integrase